MPKLGSPSDRKPNPFIEQAANRSGPFFPGLLDISRVSEPPATIVEEPTLEEDLPEEVSILDPALLSNNSNSTRPQVNTTPLPSPKNTKAMPSLPYMPLALSPSMPQWDGRARSL